MKKVMKESVKMAAKITTPKQQTHSSSSKQTITNSNSKIQAPDRSIVNGLNEQQEDLIAKAAAKAERKRKKKEEKARRKAEKRAEKKRILEEEANYDNDSDDESVVEVVEEDVNGVCTVRIEPKPIKLTIKTNGHHTTHKRLKTTPSPKPKDIRTSCNNCMESGDNSNLVRCDECRMCFHFACLNPPLKKSPKVPGYGWQCVDCTGDSDWHLD